MYYVYGCKHRHNINILLMHNLYDYKNEDYIWVLKVNTERPPILNADWMGWQKIAVNLVSSSADCLARFFNDYRNT